MFFFFHSTTHLVVIVTLHEPAVVLLDISSEDLQITVLFHPLNLFFSLLHWNTAPTVAPVFWTTRFHACYFTYDLITVESLQEGFIQQVNQLLLNEALSRQLSPCSPCSLSKHFNSLIFFLLRQIYFCLTNLKIHFWGRKLEQFFSADLLPYLHLLHYQSNDLKHSHIHFLSTRFWSVFLCSPLECD